MSGSTVPVLAEVDEIVLSFRRNVVVAASAGTGKTHRLTALYVLVTLGLTSMGLPSRGRAAAPVLPDRIWATTFTRAAAGEIAERVERALVALATDPRAERAPFAFEIAARSAMLDDPPGPQVIRRRAAEALARWPAARIDTLHGLAARLVDRHGLALGLPPGMRVLDEDEAAHIASLAIDEVLSRALGAGGDAADHARALLLASGGLTAVRAQLTRLFDRLDEEGVTPSALVLSDHGEAARAARADSPASPAPPPPRAASPACAPRRRRCRGARERPRQRRPPDDAMSAAIEFLSVAMRGKKREIDDEVDALRKQYCWGAGSLRSNAERFVTFLRRADELGARERGMVHLLEEARAGALARRRRAGALGFGDLLRAARDGLRDLPELAEEVRSHVDVLLVDEFQDTSSVQRDLVYLLRERDDARRARAPGDVPAASDLERHGLFLVGDRKQSIYGFRGADVAVFSRICGELGGEAAHIALRLSSPGVPRASSSAGAGASLSGGPGASSAAGAGASSAGGPGTSSAGGAGASSSGGPGTSSAAGAGASSSGGSGASSFGGARVDHADFVALSESRRSGAAVLGFVNAFSACDFSEGRADAAGPREYEIEYSPAEHLVPVRPPEERGTVLLIEDDAAVPDDADALTREAEGPLREALVAAAWIARHRRETGRPARDIAVLARRRNTLPLVSVALDRLGVPYVVAGRALYDAPEVRDVAGLVRLMVDPRDRLALATVLRGPCVALSDTALAALSEPGRGLHHVATMTSLPERAALLSPEEQRRLTTFRTTFGALRRAALRAPPAEALRALVTAFDLDRVLAALPRAEARLANVDRLIAIAGERGGSLATFARWLDRRIADESDEPEGVVFSDDDDAVRLLTIHGSKGLDFKVVVLVDLAAEPRPTYPGVDLVPAQGDQPASLLVRHFASLEDESDDGAPLPLVALPTPALRAAQAEARSREQAERRRLTYVALTRAKDAVVLVAPTTPPRGSSAWRTLAVALPPEARASITHVERAIDLLQDAAAARAAATSPAPSGRDAATRAAATSPAPSGRDAVGPRAAAETWPTSVHPDTPDAGGPDRKPPAHPALPTPALPAHAAPRLSPRSMPALPPAVSPTLAAPALAATPRTIALPTTAMSLFEGCARRYRLRYLLGFDEPLATTQLDLFAVPEAEDLANDARLDDEDARDVGRAAHRVLERWPAARWGEPAPPDEIAERLIAEGIDRTSPEIPRLADGIARWLTSPYVRAAREAAATLLREEPFVLEVDAPVRLALRGAMDLVVRTAEGRIDVIDYKRSRPRTDLAPYAFQLRTYALALSRRFPARPIRAGVLFLGGADAPAWLEGAAGPDLTAADHAHFESTLAALARTYSDARTADTWDGVPVDRCRALRCGFVTACHRRTRGKQDR
ncbi:MAG: UvrD-helicase domain-containing protein [Polyangiaceae bacterium]